MTRHIFDGLIKKAKEVATFVRIRKPNPKSWNPESLTNTTNGVHTKPIDKYYRNLKIDKPNPLLEFVVCCDQNPQGKKE